MKLIELECPNCGAALKRIRDDMAKCPSCGTEFLIDDEEKDSKTNQQTNTYNQPYRNQYNSQYNSTYRNIDRNHQRRKTTAIVMIIFVVVFIGITGIFFVMNFVYSQAIWNDFTSIGGNSYEYKWEDLDYSQDEKEASEGMQKFVNSVFGTDWKEIEESQLQELTYLKIEYGSDQYLIEYALADGEVKNLTMSDDLHWDMDDLAYLKGVRKLHLEETYVPIIVLEELKNLEEIWSYSTPKELSDYIENHDKIKVIGCYDADSLEGIESFGNLEELYVSDSSLSDISAISSVVGLKKLEIKKGDRISDFGVLNSLTALESLSIKSDGVKSISFVSNMKSLKHLRLEETSMIDTSPLQGMTSIESLELLSNGDVTDYAALSSLTGLKSLVLDLSYDQTMPEASAWTNLEYLSVNGVEDVSFLANLTKLSFLQLEWADCSHFDAVSNLQNLETLALRNCYGDFDNLDALKGLNNLKCLDLSDSIYSTKCINIQSVFELSSLEELNLNDLECEMDLSSIPENHNLKVLHMDRIELQRSVEKELESGYRYNSHEAVNLSDVIANVSKFPNLEELYVQSTRIADVNFAASLTKLKKLDITDNFITDLRPLESLEELEIVWCGENSISYQGEFGENVSIIRD